MLHFTSWYVMHPGETEEEIMVWWHFYSQFCSKQCPEVQLALIPVHILHNAKGFLSRHRELRGSYQHRFFTSYLQVHLYSLMAPTRNAEVSPVHNMSANDASQRKEARTVGLSCDGSIVDTKIKKHWKIISSWDLQRILRGLGACVSLKFNSRLELLWKSQS